MYIFTLLYQTKVLLTGQMDVCMNEMSATEETCLRKIYYVFGSGLFAVPGTRINEIQRLRSEYHSSEAKIAWALIRSRMHS